MLQCQCTICLDTAKITKDKKQQQEVCEINTEMNPVIFFLLKSNLLNTRKISQGWCWCW